MNHQGFRAGNHERFLPTAYCLLPSAFRFPCYLPLESQLFQTVQPVQTVRTDFSVMLLGVERESFTAEGAEDAEKGKETADERR